MCSIHCLTGYSGISSKPAENLPFKLLVTHSTSFSVTGKMNILLGQKFDLCCDIWMLTWQPFWFKSSPTIRTQEDFSISNTFSGFDIISVPLLNSISWSYYRDFPAPCLLFATLLLFYILPLQHIYCYLSFQLLIYCFVYYLISVDIVLWLPCKICILFNLFKNHILLL